MRPDFSKWALLFVESRAGWADALLAERLLLCSVRVHVVCCSLWRCQMNAQNYSVHEDGNQLSFDDWQKYLDVTYPNDQVRASSVLPSVP